MSIRRKRRQCGKRKEVRARAPKTRVQPHKAMKMKSRIGILRRRKERKERRKREGEILWKKLSASSGPQPTLDVIDWESCNVTWKDWDLGLDEFKKQWFGEWKPDERN